jgi:prolipoprotein diacylglyceryltransferase
MRQIIVELFTLELPGRSVTLRIFGYGLMLVLGFLLAIHLARWRARRSGEDPDVVTRCGLLSLLGGIVGGRIAYVIQHWQDQFADAANPLGAMLDITSGGLIYHGGLVLATVMVVVYLWRKKLPVRRYLDILAASLMLGLAFGRAGCLLNGCCFGATCGDGCSLGMRFPMYSKPLLKLTDRGMPFSSGVQEPSPVYFQQFHAGLVQPNERLFDANGFRRLWPPRYLHRRLERDQLTILLDEHRWREAFTVTSRGDGEISEADWLAGAGKEGSLLAGSENWAEAVSHFDFNGDGQLNWTETRTYLEARRDWVMEKFDADRDGQLSQVERQKANAYLQEDLIALAEASWSLPVKPAQALSILGALLLTLLLMGFHRLRTREGQVFALMAVLYPIVRFVEEGIRDQNAHDLARGVLTHNQYEAAGIAAAGMALFLLLRRCSPSAGLCWRDRLAVRPLASGRRMSG